MYHKDGALTPLITTPRGACQKVWQKLMQKSSIKL